MEEPHPLDVVALLESRWRLVNQIRSMPLASITWDLDFNVTDWNPAAQGIFGYSRDEAVGEHARLIIAARWASEPR